MNVRERQSKLEAEALARNPEIRPPDYKALQMAAKAEAITAWVTHLSGAEHALQDHEFREEIAPVNQWLATHPGDHVLGLHVVTVEDWRRWSVETRSAILQDIKNLEELERNRLSTRITFSR